MRPPIARPRQWLARLALAVSCQLSAVSWAQDQKTEDTQHVSGHVGSFGLCVRNDSAGATFTSANGDYSPFACDAQGRVFVSVPAPLSTSGGGTEATALRVTVANDSTGVLSVDDNGGSLTIDASSLPLPTGASTFAEQQTQTTALQIIDNIPLADDGTFTVGTTNIVAMGCIEATDTMDAGDVGAVKCGNDRELDVDLVSAIPAGSNNIGDVDVATIAAGDNNMGNVDVVTGPVDGSAFEVQGTIAHDSADGQNPVKIGGRARTSNVTAVANDDRVDAQFDVIGRQVVAPYTLYDNVVRGCGNATGTSDTAVIAAAGSGVRNYITSISVINTSSTSTYVTMKDGSTALYEIAAPASSSAIGGAIVTLPVPLRTTANTAFNFASAAGVTTMRVCAAGFTAP